VTDKKPNIFVVDDDPSIGKALGRLLKSLDYSSTIFTSAEAFLKDADMKDDDCLILDIMLPGMDGLELQQELKKRESHIPVIMLTVKDKENDKVLGLELGADDYVTKPFSVRELSARVKTNYGRQDKYYGDADSCQ